MRNSKPKQQQNSLFFSLSLFFFLSLEYICICVKWRKAHAVTSHTMTFHYCLLCYARSSSSSFRVCVRLSVCVCVCMNIHECERQKSGKEYLSATAASSHFHSLIFLFSSTCVCTYRADSVE